VAGGDRVASQVTDARKALTSGTRLPERERSRESEGECGWRVGPGSQRRSGARARGRASDGPLGSRGRKGGVGARERERGVWAGNGPDEGECFPFYFSNFYFLFLFLLSLFLLNK
jgi:hypothetical protein